MSKSWLHHYGIAGCPDGQLTHYDFRFGHVQKVNVPCVNAPEPEYRPCTDSSQTSSFTSSLKASLLARSDSKSSQPSEFWTPKTSFSIQRDARPQFGRPRADTKTSFISQVLKRKLSVSEDERSAKRVKSETSKTASRYRKVLRKRARDIAAIVTASAEERRKYGNDRKLTFEEQLEEHRRAHPETRPDYQKTYLVNKQKELFPGTAYDFLEGPQDFQVLIEEHNAEKRQQAALHADFHHRCQMSIMAGQPLPGRPVQGHVPSLGLDPYERHRARIGAFERDGCFPDDNWDESKGLTYTQKVAIGLSKILDPLKKLGRTTTEDVDMDLGMFDEAPAELMETCSRCQQPTQSYLVNGMCRFCIGHRC